MHEHGGSGEDPAEVRAAGPAVDERDQVEAVRVEDAADPLHGLRVQLVDLEQEKYTGLYDHHSLSRTLVTLDSDFPLRCWAELQLPSSPGK